MGEVATHKKKGFLRLYRSVFDDGEDGDVFWIEGLKTGDFRRWAAWLWCLSLVNFRTVPNRLTVRERLILIPPGHFYVTQEGLARKVGWESRISARHFLSKCEELHRIRATGFSHAGPFYVLNWHQYNPTASQRKTSGMSHSRATVEPHIRTIEHEKHVLQEETQERSLQEGGSRAPNSEGAEPKPLPAETRSDLHKIANAKRDATRGGPPRSIGQILPAILPPTPTAGEGQLKGGD